jgi:hypothetical protein
MKFLDNIAKTFAATGAMFIVATLSIVKFGEPFRIELVLGCLIAAVAVDVYYHGELLLDKKKDDDFLDDEELVVVQGSSSTSRGEEKNATI